MLDVEWTRFRSDARERVEVQLVDGHALAADEAYLLALAVRRGGAIASFDTALPVTAVRGASRKHLLAI